MATTYQRKCGRCAGTGYYADRGECFACRMRGTVTVTRYTAAEKAAIKARDARIAAARTAVRNCADRIIDSHIDRCDVHTAFGRLRDDEPARFEKLLASVEAGRVEAVTRHLLTYWNETTGGTEATAAVMVAAVKAHALKAENYSAGWDTVAECYTDEEIVEVLETHGATTVAAAIEAFGKLADVWDDQAKTAAWMFSY